MSLVSCVHIPPRQEISILFVFLWFDGMNHWKHLAPLAVALSPATRWFNIYQRQFHIMKLAQTKE